MASAPLTHHQIWTALDRLAERSDLSPSGLAKKSGLDPTTFNKSKRITPDGRARWPSTESIAKALAATGASVEAFVSLISETNGAARAVPLIGFAEAGAGRRHRCALRGRAHERSRLPAMDPRHHLHHRGGLFDPRRPAALAELAGKLSAVIPGRRNAPNPESRNIDIPEFLDSGFAPSARPGMTSWEPRDGY